MKRIVTGVLAHVDSGKTTLSEALLYLSGTLRKPGRVDHGDAFLDNYRLERERGITIFSKQANLQLGKTSVTLLDTPGHVDFGPEMERTLQVLDCAVLLISAADGVQSHTQTLWQLLRMHGIPTFIFINKTDLAGIPRDELMAEIREKLGDGCVEFRYNNKASQKASGSSKEESMLSCFDFSEEEAAECDEKLLESFFEGAPLKDRDIISAVSSGKLFPCFSGSALKMTGTDGIAAALDLLTEEPHYSAKFGAKVFKITRDSAGNRLTHMKITGGFLKVRSTINCKPPAHSAAMPSANDSVITEKINQIRIYSGEKFQPVDEVLPGMICAVTGPQYTRPGQGLGEEKDSEFPVLTPVLNYEVRLQPGYDVHKALTNLRILEEEEPELHVVWNETLSKIYVQLMGEVQTEILKVLLMERFGMDVEFERGSILYRETISEAFEGVGHFEPLRHYAEVHLLLEPLPRGGGIIFDSDCSEDELDRNWQRLILTHLEEKEHIGVMTGSPLCDMKITLVAGRAHEKHTEGGDFRQATYRALRQGLRTALEEGKVQLLEPWYAFRLSLPTENVGKAMSDLQRMNAEFEPPKANGGMSEISGSAPVACMQDYQLEVSNYTHGSGKLFCTLKGYELCHNMQEVAQSCGYDCDRDIENTADSVFCTHGSGTAVKWNLVPEYMHLPSIFSRRVSDEGETELVRRASFTRRAATDSELMAIFEKTYGPLRQNLPQKKKVSREATESTFNPGKKAYAAKAEANSPAGDAYGNYKGKTPKATFDGPEFLLVDGYNIIFAWEELRELAKANIDSARDRLIDIMCNYQGYTQCELILVFDAYKVRHNAGRVEKTHGISVVYTREAETADMYIEKVTHRMAGKRRIRVATSDNLEQMIIFGHGALKIDSKAFLAEVKSVEEAIRDILSKL
ncbi:MAG: TetM/TetW/TetO/TetS family tetracycline resistance ribosomal protection protein [Clostridia bacterium]|nr:TetM/TetW/TetO/TetS family tetracycline resistance ribosomal protection protein [Clostridia bacterium]